MWLGGGGGGGGVSLGDVVQSLDGKTDAFTPAFHLYGGTNRMKYKLYRSKKEATTHTS